MGMTLLRGGRGNVSFKQLDLESKLGRVLLELERRRGLGPLEGGEGFVGLFTTESNNGTWVCLSSGAEEEDRALPPPKV